MLELLIALALPFTQPELETPPKAKVPTLSTALDALPPPMLNITVGNSGDGDKGWIKLEDVLVDRQGKAFLKKAAKLTVSETPDHKLCVRFSKDAVALDVWAFYVFEPTTIGNRNDLVAVTEIYLKFREKK